MNELTRRPQNPWTDLSTSGHPASKLDDEAQPPHPHPPRPTPHVAAAPVAPASPDAIDRAFGHWVDDVAVTKDGVDATTTTTKGNTTNSSSISAGGGKVSVSDTTTKKSGDDSTATTTTASLQGSSVGASTSTTKTADGVTTATSVSGSVDPTKGNATIAGSATQNGNGVNGSVQSGADGTTVTGGVTGQTGPVTGGLSVSAGTDGTTSVTAQGGVDAGGVKAGVTYTIKHSEPGVTKVVTDDTTSNVASMFGGPPSAGYMAVTRSDSTTLGGSVGFKGLGLAADSTNTSSMQVFQQLPAGWASMTPVEQKAWQDTHAKPQLDLLAKAQSLGDVDPATMPDGLGLHYTTYNGWNASGGLSYGVASISGGGGQSSASDVAIVKTGNLFQISMVRQDGVSSQVGMAMAGFGIGASQKTSDSHQVAFSIDTSTPAGLQEMKDFMQTGLLPWDRNKMTAPKDQVAKASFDAAKTQVDSLNTNIKAIETQMAQPGFDVKDAKNAPLVQSLRAMYTQMDTAQRTLELNKNFLNDEWQATYGQQLSADPNAGPAAGVTMTKITDTHQDTAGGSLSTPITGDVEVGRDERAWVHQSYRNAQGGTDDKFSFDDKKYLFNTLSSEQSVATDTNQSNVVLSMYSDNAVTLGDNAAIIKGIQNSNLPPYVADQFIQYGNQFHLDPRIYDNLSGRTNVQLTATQLNAITTNLNDMSNPQSKQMWSDIATRTSAFMAGGDWTNKTGDANADAMFAQGQKDMRQQWINGIEARDPNDPLRKALDGYGKDPQAALASASAQFATIKTPADFQKLSIEQQQLYISVIEQTSGRDHDLTGKTSTYEAMAAVSLVHDNTARAQGMRDLFQNANDAATRGGEFGDGVWDFVKFNERFKDTDPATYALVQKGISFDWKQGDVEDLVKNNKPEDITKQFGDAYKGWDNVFGHHDDPGKMFQLVEAANRQGGVKELQAMVTASGADPKAMLDRMANDPLRQHMLYDMLVSAGYAGQVAGADLRFQ